MNREIIDKVIELSYVFLKHNLNGEFELMVDADTYYKIRMAYLGDESMLYANNTGIFDFVIQGPAGPIRVLPKKNMYNMYMEYNNEDDKYPY